MCLGFCYFKPSSLQVAVHEIGHVLGLFHVNNENSIMYPIYHNIEDNFEIGRDDRRAVQQLYGVCKGRFDVIMDWVRKKYPSGSFIPEYKYNSYFFRGDSYWLYENPEDRPRYGDPLEVRAQWTGLPSNMDGYAQIFTEGLFEYEITTLFFKGLYSGDAPIG
jgi:matrix metalloproteinase-21